MNRLAVRAQGLGRRFGRRWALRDIGLNIAAGEVFGLVGPDGAGKTTLMQLLAAILDPSEGDAVVLGANTRQHADAVTASIGYMSQGFTLYDKLSVDENLAFSASIRGIRGALFAERRQRLLAMAGLLSFTARRADQLSGGMRKKLSLCCNLIHEPPLLLLDEPSLGVDPVSRAELWRILRDYQTGGAAVVITTPYMDEAERCDRLALLFGGRLLAIDTPAGLRERARGRVFEVDAIPEHLPDLLSAQWVQGRLRLLSREPLSDPTMRPVAPTLEDAFIWSAGKPDSVDIPAPPPAPPSEAPSTVMADSVTVRFGDFTAVDRVSVAVRAGEVVGWLGPNGAGKTTLIRVFCGLLRPSAGRAVVAGVEVNRKPLALRGRIGYMSQQFSLYPDLTGAENLRFFAGVYGLSGARGRDAISWASRMTGIEDGQRERVAALSGALRQRLALACAVMHRPTVLFLDEPTSGTDPMARRRFWDLIQRLAAGGMTVFVTTHYLEEARYCHRLGMMDRGRLIAWGSNTDLRRGLGLAPSADMDDVFMGYLARGQPP